MEKKMIVSDPKVMMGKPVIAGTRITVELILEKFVAHPKLTRETIRAAQTYCKPSA
jgi:uncharacterized protein (DUF433 family)